MENVIDGSLPNIGYSLILMLERWDR